MRAVVASSLAAEWRVEERTDPRPGRRDVLVAVEASGICYSDVHLLRDPGYGGTFPRVPGHEFVGRVVEAGTDVSDVAVGERVGVAWAQRWCRCCRACAAGLTSFCEKGADVTGGTVDGGHAQLAVVDAAAVERVPDEIPSEQAAPLFCAGHTVFSALRSIDVRPGERVAVVGIGGLGHLALQYAQALGAETVAVTRSADKLATIEQLGAAETLVASGAVGAALRDAGGCDAILATGNGVDPDLATGLRAGGRLAVAGMSDTRIALTPRQLVFDRLSLVGASPGSRRLLRELLRLHAASGARTMVETFALDCAGEALSRVVDGTIRYRAVLVPGGAG